MIRAILFKELRVFFRSPLAYIIAGLFSLIVGWIFFNQLSYFVENIQKIPVAMRNQYDFSNEVVIKFFGNINFLLLFITPLVTMKIFSEEFKEGTIDIYYTSAVSDYELILGKFLSVIVQGLFLLATTFIFPFFLSNIQLSDVSFIFTGYIGLVLNFTCYAALGCLASSLTRHQILSALMAFILILFIWMMTMFAQMTSNYLFSEILSFISINKHFENFVKANIFISDITYYMSFITLILLLIKKRLGMRQWI
ncbi:MAG: ABC transporter permease subunit [Halobacteriovoraceae bacterium]|jgi:ABC-2 type transport system permease protein|nr:ABC transporter permease subunit [Halobacteriovoraceae bacterium]